MGIKTCVPTVTAHAKRSPRPSGNRTSCPIWMNVLNRRGQCVGLSVIPVALAPTGLRRQILWLAFDHR